MQASRTRAPRLTLGQMSNFLPITAMFYDTWRERSLSWLTRESFNLKREFALMLEWLHVQPDQRFLDVGTSTGNYARAVEKSGAVVTAIDISQAMLERARKQSAGLEITFERVNVEAMPYPDSSFDGVVVGASLNEFHDTGRALEEMARVLKPDGRLFMMYLRESDTAFGKAFQLMFKLGGIRFPNRERVRQQCAELGLVQTRAEVRRAVTFELYVKREATRAESPDETRKLARAPGKPAREPIV
jgi:ubiquinone/menaquinone biosynthesis C-methylase UbiE